MLFGGKPDALKRLMQLQSCQERTHQESEKEIGFAGQNENRFVQCIAEVFCRFLCRFELGNR